MPGMAGVYAVRMSMSTAEHWNIFMLKTSRQFVRLAVAAVAIGVASPALAVTDIMWWHAMSGELGRQLQRLAADFNASQSDYRIVASYKGSYTETVTAAIFASRSRSQRSANSRQTQAPSTPLLPRRTPGANEMPGKPMETEGGGGGWFTRKDSTDS